MSTRTAAPTLPAFLTLAETLTVLGLSRQTFLTHYVTRFTDPRPVERRRSGVPRLFRRSEVEVVVSDGWEALANKLAMDGRRKRLAK